MQRFVIGIVGLVAIGACYETQSTIGLVCEVDTHCDADQACVDGTCQLAGATERGVECSADGSFYCGYGDCFCGADTPFCCGDGHCYASMDECAQAWGVPDCPEGGQCSVCRVQDERIDYCPSEVPYCCFENGPEAADVYCNQSPDGPCG